MIARNVWFIDVMWFYVQLLNNPKMIEELQNKHFTELCRKYTGHFSLETSLNWLILHSIAQHPQEIFVWLTCKSQYK